MTARTAMATTLAALALLTWLGGAAGAAEFRPGPGFHPPCGGGDCFELSDRISRVDVLLEFSYRSAIQNQNGSYFEHLLEMVVTIPDQGKFQFHEMERQGVVANLMWIYLRGPQAEGAVNLQATLPDGRTKFGSCYLTPALAPECVVVVDLDRVETFSSTLETQWALRSGRYTVRVIYADGSRARMVFYTGDFPFP